MHPHQFQPNPAQTQSNGQMNPPPQINSNTVTSSSGAPINNTGMPVNFPLQQQQQQPQQQVANGFPHGGAPGPQMAQPQPPSFGPHGMHFQPQPIPNGSSPQHGVGPQPPQQGQHQQMAPTSGMMGGQMIPGNISQPQMSHFNPMGGQPGGAPMMHPGPPAMAGDHQGSNIPVYQQQR